MLRLSPRVSTAGSVTDVDYAKSDKTRSFQASKALFFNNSSGVGTSYTINSGTVVDWYDQQQLALNTPIYWNTIAGKPVDSNYSDQRSGGGDAIHVAGY